jgi:ABC-type molybdate transport system substrate-binding protein
VWIVFLATVHPELEYQLTCGIRIRKTGLTALALIGTTTLMTCAMAQDKQPELTIFAAGSLRTAVTQVAQDFAAQTGVQPRLVFGASGLLRDRLAGGERADLFASANMEHPQALERSGHATSVRPFTRNELCALATAGFAADARSLVMKLLDPRWRLGTSTPKADPSGDYAFEMFDRIEATGAGPAGSAAALKQRALQLTGGPQSPPPPTSRNVYGALVAQGQADVFITYCTNAAIALTEEPQLKSLPIEQSINVSATYGLATMKGAVPMTQRFLDHVLGPQGQQRLRALGFSK